MLLATKVIISLRRSLWGRQSDCSHVRTWPMTPMPGSSDIDAQLKARGIDTVLITGTATNVCCESTARDAMLLDYKVVMLSDGNATFTEEEHASSLNTFMMYFGDVMSTDETIARLTPVAARISTSG
jgi:nicotinamidase-related amidase